MLFSMYFKHGAGLCGDADAVRGGIFTASPECRTPLERRTVSGRFPCSFDPCRLSSLHCMSGPYLRTFGSSYNRPTVRSPDTCSSSTDLWNQQRVLARQRLSRRSTQFLALGNSWKFSDVYLVYSVCSACLHGAHHQKRCSAAVAAPRG